MFIDVHCHLDYFENKELDGIIEECRKKGVKCILTNGVNVPNNKKVLEICGKYDEVRACLGIYPIDALKLSDKEIDAEIEFIRKNKDRVYGIGEVGMDFKESENEKDWKKQEKTFRKFIKLSNELKIPVTVHSRKAEEKCIEVLEEEKANKVVMHCFSGKLKLIQRILKNGWLLSIPTAVKNSQHFQEVIKLAPIDNLLCETDSPYLHPDKEFPNTPPNVIESYKKIAEIKKASLKEAERKIEDNFKRLFGKI